MTNASVSGALLITGSLLFMIAAFLPTYRVFVEPSSRRRLEILRSQPTTWLLSQWLFGLGALVTGTGLLITAAYLSGIGGGLWALAGAALVTVGAIPWVLHVFLRATRPADFANDRLPGWHFRVYTTLTVVGLILFGVGLMQTPYPGWLAWLSIGYPALLFVGYLVFRDMPPFTYYLLSIVIGVTLLSAAI